MELLVYSRRKTQITVQTITPAQEQSDSPANESSNVPGNKDPFDIDLPIALWKGVRTCASHPIFKCVQQNSL